VILTVLCAPSSDIFPVLETWEIPGIVSKFAISREIYILFYTMVACSDKGIKNYYITIF
jgi:hypothetical protein